MAVRVHLADDHTMFRQGLESILASHEGIEDVGRSSTGGDDAAALVGENTPNVVITQIDTNLGTAREVLSRIRSASQARRSSCSPCSTTSATCRLSSRWA